MSKEDRIREVQKNYYNIDIVLHKDLLRAYGQLCLRREEVMYKKQKEAMDKVTNYLDDLSLDIDSEFTKTIKILTSLDKMWKGLESAYSKMMDAKTKINTRGNIKESYREKRSKS